MRKLALLILLAVLASNLLIGIVFGTYSLIVDGGAEARLVPTQALVIMTLYFSLAIVIVSFSKQKPAPLSLAGVVMAIGASYVTLPVGGHASALNSGIQQLLYFMSSLTLDALMLPLLWLFAYHFRGQTKPAIDVTIRSFMVFATISAAVLLVSNLLMGYMSLPQLAMFERRGNGTLFWLIAWATLPIVYVVLYWKYRTSDASDHLAYRYLFASLLLGVPALILVFGGIFIPGFSPFLQSDLGRALLVNPANFVILGIPVVMAYSVLMDEDFSRESNRVRFVISTVLIKIVLILPIIGGVWSLFMLRDTRIGELHTNIATSALLVFVLLFFLARRYESVWEQYVKKRFYRDQVETAKVLAEFSGSAGRARTLDELVARVLISLERALGVTETNVHTIDPFSGNYLSLGMNNGAGAMPGLRSNDSILLGENEPLVAISLGAKDNGDELDDGDRAFLSKVKSVADIHIVRLQEGVHHSSHRVFKLFELAAECERCGRLQNRGEATCATCFGDIQAASLPMKVDNLNVTQKIGAGSFGKVYEAVDRSLNRYVALKVLPPEVAQSNLQEISHEGRVMAAFDHPHLARVYGIDYWRDVPFLVTELFQEGTLEKQIGNLSKNKVLTILEGLMLGLRYIHGKGVLHLDIKPSNIALSSEGNVKILDFGTSNLAMAGSSLQTDDVISDANMRQTVTTKKLNGTPIYMCPEGLMGERPDELFDFWSAAVSVLELATGNHPFLRDNWQHSFLAISRGEVSSDFGISVQRLLSPKRSERATDPDEIESLIRQLVLELP